MRILVTNDDGIDSVGLHKLAAAVARHGEVIVVAPDSEYSGSSAAFGALHMIRPEIHEVQVGGVERAYTVNGPPGLCVLLARLGLFGPERPDLIVAGINPGANVGRSVYHSGTVGAAITGRSGGIPGVAFSQEVSNFGVEGQGWEDALASQLWDSAVTVADIVVGALVAQLPSDGAVLNVNIPNLPVEEFRGWKYAEVGVVPPRPVSSARLEPRPGHTGSYWAIIEYGGPVALPEHLDGGAVEAGYVTLSWLSRMVHEARDDHRVDAALDRLLPTTR